MLSLQSVILIVVVLTGVSHAAKWSYEGDAGPLNWHELFPHACSGRHQSPIDFRPEQTSYNPDLRDFAIWYDPPKPDSKLYIKNNGHTVQVDLEGDFFVTNGGLPNVYKSVQFHFHWGHKSHHGSEHLIEGKASPIEMHVVSYNHDLYADIGEAVMEKGGLAVLGVMFEVTPEDNPRLETIVKAIKHIRDPESRTRISLPLMSLRDLLPEDISRYYRYNGSLTTPGCFESVIWTVFDTKQTISHRQLKEFRTLLQFKHKHRSHSKANSDSHGGNRHRRSLTRSQRKLERRAEDVLEELGIKGNHFEEAVLQAQLMEKKQRQVMMGDMPHGSEHKTTRSHNDHKPTMDEERAAKIDKSIDDHMGHNVNDKKYDTEGHTINPEEMTVVDYEYRQDILVNNFRPAQPLNGRVVQRSFKLRDLPPPVEHDGHLGHSHADNHGSHSSGHGDHHNAASANSVSMMAVLILSIWALIFV